MKIKSLLFGMMTCVALAACTNEDLVENEGGNGVDNSMAKAYLGIRIANPQGDFSRATTDGGFENGSGEEQGIQNALFVFYKNGAYVLSTKIEETISLNENEAGNNVEATSDAVIVLDAKPENMPNQVVAFLNLPDDAKEQLNNMTLDNAIKYAASKDSEIASYAGNNSFIMTNSVYLDTNNKIVCATPVTNANFSETKDNALKNPITIYVERIAAKVEMAAKDNDINNVETKSESINTPDGAAELRLVIDGWGLNGLNKKSYLLKNIEESWVQNFDWSWNSSNNYRSYWAKDNNYSSGEATYPSNHEDYDTNSPLEYISWNNIQKNNMKAQYCLENTMDATVADNINATTHMLIVGHYELWKNGTKVEDVNELYKYATVYYTKNELINKLASNFNNHGGIYTMAQEGENKTYTPVNVNMFSLKRASLSEAKLYFNATEGVTYYKNVGAGKYEAYKNADEINTAILNQLGTATAYNDGLKTFFYTNIEHLNDKKKEVGNIGIVRNHVYRLTLNSIKHMGEGVYDPNEEIIINKKDKEFYVGATLNILAWKVVNQDVDL